MWMACIHDGYRERCIVPVSCPFVHFERNSNIAVIIFSCTASAWKSTGLQTTQYGVPQSPSHGRQHTVRLRHRHPSERRSVMLPSEVR